MNRHDLILAVGVSLILVGIMLRSAHQNQRRDDALHAQTALLARLDGKEDTLNTTADPAKPASRRFPWVYSGIVLLGALLTIAAFVWE